MIFGLDWPYQTDGISAEMYDDEPPTRICPTCGEEIDADDEGCPDDGGTA